MYALDLEVKHLGSNVLHPRENENNSSAKSNNLGSIVLCLTKKESDTIKFLTELGYDDDEIVEECDPHNQDGSLRDSIDNLSLPYITREHVYNLLYELNAPEECLGFVIEEITKFVVPIAAKAAEARQAMNSFVVFAHLEVNIDRITGVWSDEDNDDHGDVDYIDGGTMTDVVTLSLADGTTKVNASESAIAELKREGYCADVNDSSSSSRSSCVVCMEDFKVGAVITYMPCSHFFHDDCLVPWLQESNCCPLCRFQIASD
ncbi:hypothetical protein MKW94_014091 [Papaver nudicaule]|uniref:RING-type domain-containing protein n=1 Tax=Papaver nudicaule TaxID=74823 RepID=A0AA41V7U5_PAPNU|nr:hypothetical protein [Papaver nudicaule]